MNDQSPREFANVTAVCKANVFFDGKVISHTLFLADGSKKTLGLLFPGCYTFTTAVAERMEIISGACRARLAGADWADYPAGTFFDVPANVSFEIEAVGGIAEYVCSFA